MKPALPALRGESAAREAEAEAERPSPLAGRAKPTPLRTALGSTRVRLGRAPAAGRTATRLHGAGVLVGGLTLTPILTLTFCTGRRARRRSNPNPNPNPNLLHGAGVLVGGLTLTPIRTLTVCTGRACSSEV
eukprot:scaffold20859_cov42-Phaeocystis_antarctica.AAC.1